MPKFYIESGPVRLIFDAATAEQAAVMAFQWTCDKQAEIAATTPLDHVLEAEQRGWQLGDEVWVSEQGFGRWDGEAFETQAVCDLSGENAGCDAPGLSDRAGGVFCRREAAIPLRRWIHIRPRCVTMLPYGPTFSRSDWSGVRCADCWATYAPIPKPA